MRRLLLALSIAFPITAYGADSCDTLEVVSVGCYKAGKTEVYCSEIRSKLKAEMQKDQIDKKVTKELLDLCEVSCYIAKTNKDEERFMKKVKELKKECKTQRATRLNPNI